MSFREKILWTTLIAGIAPYLWYFGSATLLFVKGAGAASLTIGGLVTAIIGGLVMMIVAVAVANRHDGTVNPDEREQRIESKGFTISYHLLSTGVMITVGAAWLGWNAVTIIHILAFVFILAELTRIGVEIHGLRRGY